jgi:hypothetical protein
VSFPVQQGQISTNSPPFRVALDADGDGWNYNEDCDDSDANNFPGNTEVCDGLDNDCDGMLPADELDTDMDGLMECEGDCDDSDPGAFPGAEEICDDGIDQDCDGEDLICGDDDDSAGAEDGTLQGSGGCSCEAIENRGPAGASILFLGLAGLILRRHSR